jgi:DNA-binding response OmpR family regulator
MRIPLVEDQPDAAPVIAKGFANRPSRSMWPLTASSVAAGVRTSHDAIVLDVMLPS